MFNFCNFLVGKVQAQGLHLDPSALGEGNADNLIKSEGGAEVAVNSFVLGMADTILYFAAAVAVVVLVIGAAKLLKGMGNEEAVGQAKQTIIYSLVGLVVIIFSYAIVHTVIRMIFLAGA